VVTGGPEPKVYEDAGVRISGSHIAQIAGAGDLARAYPDDTLWPARDRVVMPGFVNTHAHLARHLARGLGLRSPREWRAYDRALCVADVTHAVTAALVEGLRHGVTTVVDFHRSGACLDLSLSEVMGAADKVGVRVATCYGAAEEDTPLERRAIDQSVTPRRSCPEPRRFRGMLGVQATTLHGIETPLAEAMEAAGGRQRCNGPGPGIRAASRGGADARRRAPVLGRTPSARHGSRARSAALAARAARAERPPLARARARQR
jgi:cytosine/adenosine deaminase-related metal-dependent hydrolase